jgi:diguanylate cyclase (GGDEF)-like protein
LSETRTRARAHGGSGAQRLTKHLFDDAPVGLFTVDRRLVVRRANEKGRHLLGVHRRSAAVGRRLLDELDDATGRRLMSAVSSLAPADGMSMGEVRWQRNPGDPRVLRVEARARPKGDDVLLAFIDVTEARAEADSAEHRARHDSLTGLPNRSAILDQLAAALQAARAGGWRLAVMFVDLDHFKALNDSLGHEAGDGLLCEVARRLKTALEGHSVAARLGGDEFLVLLPTVLPADDPVALADQLLASLGQPLQLSGKEIRPSASVGVSLFPDDGIDATTLLRLADLALYRAKQGGRNAVHFYEAGMDADAQRRPRLRQELEQAVERSELCLHYQPQVELATGRIAGMGALVRWVHPQEGLVHPERFIPLAEETGLIHPIGQWVLHTAVTQLQAWREQGLEQLRLSVKVSPRQLEQPGVDHLVGELIQSTGLPPRMLQLQLAESALASGSPKIFDALGALRRVGVGLALDRFGTGASSLADLPRVMPDAVRVDRTLVARLPEAADGRALVTAIVALARPLGLKVLADGVETAEQQDFLKGIGVDEIQGHIAGAPMPAEAATQCLLGTRAA